MTREFTGWHMLAIICTGFGIIIAVNLTLAFKAISTFPGLETRNSYVASQSFDLDRAAQDALGWDVDANLSDGMLTVIIRNADSDFVRPKVVSAVFGRATHTGDDMQPDFVWDGQKLIAPVDAQDGYWNLRLALEAPDGTPFRRRFPVSASNE